MACIKKVQVFDPNNNVMVPKYEIYFGDLDNLGVLYQSTLDEEKSEKLLNIVEDQELAGGIMLPEVEIVAVKKTPVPADNSDIDNSNNSPEQSSDSTSNESSTTGDVKSTVVRDALVKYSSTLVKDKIKYSPAEASQLADKIKALDEKHANDFEQKAKIIKNAAVAKMKAFDALRRAELLAQMPGLMLDYRNKRFNSTNEEKYGKDGIKKSVPNVLSQLAVPLEIVQEALDAAEEVAVQGAMKANTMAKNKAAEKAQEAMDKAGQQKAEALKKNVVNTAHGNAKAIAESIGKQYDHQIDEMNEKIANDYQEYEKGILEDAEKAGEKWGNFDVQVYNKAIVQTAQQIYNLQEKTLGKAKIAASKAIQTAKLQLGAKLGL